MDYHTQPEFSQALAYAYNRVADDHLTRCIWYSEVDGGIGTGPWWFVRTDDEPVPEQGKLRMRLFWDTEQHAVIEQLFTRD